MLPMIVITGREHCGMLHVLVPVGNHHRARSWFLPYGDVPENGRALGVCGSALDATIRLGTAPWWRFVGRASEYRILR